MRIEFNFFSMDENHIEIIFDKIFQQLHLDEYLLTVPYVQLKMESFFSHQVQQVISDVLKCTIGIISVYLQSASFQERYLFNKMKNMMYVYILLNNDVMFRKYISFVMLGDNIKLIENIIQLLVVNNKFDLFLETINTYPKIGLEHELMHLSAILGYEHFYHWFKNKNMRPNLRTYLDVVKNNHYGIMKDISSHIGLTDKITENAFISNHTEIIKEIISLCQSESKKISPNYCVYPLMYQNMEILKILIDTSVIEWHPELYYAALLSGSFEIVNLVENHIDNIHQNLILDSSKTTKTATIFRNTDIDRFTNKNILLKDISYVFGGKKYFSHTINYAIQSGSTKMIDYIYQKGYGITVSNLLTALQSDFVVFQKVIDLIGNFPIYLLHYLSPWSYITQKYEKFDYIIKNNYMHVASTYNKIILQKETVHVQIIDSNKTLAEENTTDLDFLLNTKSLFTSFQPLPYLRRKITLVKLSLETGHIDTLMEWIKQKAIDTQENIISDAIFIFGNIQQIKQLISSGLKIPSKVIIKELITRNSLGKISLIKNLFNYDFMTESNLIYFMGNSHILQICGLKLPHQKNQIDSKKINQCLQYIILSGNTSWIEQLLEYYAEFDCKHNKNCTTDVHQFTLHIVKIILSMNNINLIKKVTNHLKKIDPQILIEYCNEMGLYHVLEFLS